MPCVWHDHTSLSLQLLPTTGGRGWWDKYLPRDPIQEKENYYKKGVKRDKEGGAKTPQHIEGIKKDSPDCDEDQSSLMKPVHPNLIVQSTMMTVVHTLKPSSLTHSLQIHLLRLWEKLVRWGIWLLVTVKLLSTRIPWEDHFGSGASCAKAPHHFQEHTAIVIAQPPFWVTLRSAHYKGRIFRQRSSKGFGHQICAPMHLSRG